MRTTMVRHPNAVRDLICRLAVLCLATAALLPAAWPAPAAQAVPGAQSALYEGQFVRTPDGNVWLVWRGFKYQIWATSIDTAVFDQATPGEPITSYWQLIAHTAVVQPAPDALAPFDGSFVIGADAGIWLLSSGQRYPLLPTSVPDSAISDLPRGPDVRNTQGLPA